MKYTLFERDTRNKLAKNENIPILGYKIVEYGKPTDGWHTNNRRVWRHYALQAKQQYGWYNENIFLSLFFSVEKGQHNVISIMISSACAKAVRNHKIVVLQY